MPNVDIYSVGCWELIYLDGLKIYFHDEVDFSKGLELLIEHATIHDKITDLEVSWNDGEIISEIYGDEDARWENTVPNKLSKLVADIAMHQKEQMVHQAKELESQACQLRQQANQLVTQLANDK